MIAKQEAVKFPRSLANIEMIVAAREKGLAQAMADWPEEPYDIYRQHRLRAGFFAALRDLGILEELATLAQVPADYRRQELITAVRRLLWVATVRVLMHQRGAKLNVDHMKAVKAARTKLLQARDALQRLSGLDTAPIEREIALLSLLVGANPSPAATTGPGPREGSDRDWVFNWLVRELLRIVRSFDATLTLSKLGDEPRGTLVQALDLLRPHLGCIPAPLSYKTLARLRA